MKELSSQELRIGNYVEYGGVISKVYLLSHIYFQVESTDIPIFKASKNRAARPIPLTEEWLIKFGFSREVKVGSEMGTDGVEFRVYHFDVLTFNTNHGWWYKVQRINDTPLEYVHQLQNFYFALTGKELTLEP